ncbi:MAG: hypothetical protein E7658_05520 [Ruminococcaceae bacterium]|nr:hypothetical protein [Oscillospiraceae bacterium]
MKINRYFNAPLPLYPTDTPVICAGVNFSVKDNGRPVLRFIIKRDISVKISSFTIVYRFSDLPIGSGDPDKPFFRLVCNNEDINLQEFIVIRGNYRDEEIPAACTAVVASVTLATGEVLNYKPDTFRDPHCHSVTADKSTVGPLLDAFFRSRSNEKPQPQATPAKGSVNSLIARAAAVLDEENNGQAAVFLKKKRIGRTKAKVIAAAVAVFAILLTAGLLIRHMNRPVVSPLEAAAADLLADGRYGDAYKTVLDHGDNTILQSVCRTAAEHYQHIKDYKTAYLYACAAPEPFDTEIINSFIDILLNQSRQEEAYEFLLNLPQYTDAMQKVCASAVDAFLEREDFAKAYFYAANAPESLEAYVMQKSSGQIMESGELNGGILDSLGQTDDPEKFDEMASWAAESLSSGGAYTEAASVANRIHDPDKRSAALESLCTSGMKVYLDKSDLPGAVSLFESCSAGMKEEAAAGIMVSLKDYANSIGNAAGILYFSNILGEDTSALTVTAGDYGIKRAGIVWQYMTTAQKRAYHARPLDIYKEVYRIENGTVEGITDAVSVAASEHMAIVLLNNGTVKALSNNGRNKIPALPADNDIVSMDLGQEHAVFLHANGTVTVSGNAAWGQNDTSAWTDVTKVVAGAYYTAALRSDGTVYACGSNKSGQCNVSGITGVIDIAACDDTLILHMKDNTLKLVGDVSMGLKGAAGFSDIVKVRAGGNTILAETERGTCVMAHASFNASAGLVLTWKNMPDFAAGFLCAAGINENGTLLITGDGSAIVHDGYEPGIQ